MKRKVASMEVADARENGGNLVTCRGLIWHSGRHLVLDRLDLDLGCGEALALLGSSGSGKTTLLRVIAGLEMPEQGEVRIDGQLATQANHLMIPPHRRQLAMLFQDLALWPNLSVAGNVALGLSGLGLPRQARRRRVQEALQKCDIADLGDRLPGTLSGGQQQRVALARALSMQPRVLLLDEPFGGLDLLTRQSVIREVAALKRTLGFSLIVVTHDPEEFRLLCDTLAVLEAGRIVDRGPIDTIASAGQSKLAQAFITLARKSSNHG
jgi:iron(III) transport system ATP-binding protein